MSAPSVPARPSPTYVNMGLDGEMLLRLDAPVRQELEKLYDEVYKALDAPGREAPRPGLGKFIGFAAALGGDEIRRKYLERSDSGGSPRRARDDAGPNPTLRAGRGAKGPARKRAAR